MSLCINTLLLALALVESNNNDYAVGSSGERSRYQITERVWKQHTKYDFKKWAHQKGTARTVAICHVKWLQAHVPKCYHDDPYYLALCWRYGRSGASKRYWHYHQNSYAQRVANIYHAIIDNRYKP